MSIDTLTDLDLGSFLVEKKVITPEQFQECLKIHQLNGGYLSQYFIRRGHIKDADLTTHLTCYYGFCYLPLASYHITESTLATVPGALARDFCLIPIEKNDKLLSVAMADPLNKGVIEILRLISHCEIVIFIATRAEIKEAIEKNYRIPYMDFAFEDFDDDITLRDDILSDYVSGGVYSGPNRRHFRRLNEELTARYYIYPDTIQTKTLNISLNGIVFEADAPIQKGSQIAIEIGLDDGATVIAVAEIARNEISKIIDAGVSRARHATYEIGAFFNFMTAEHRRALADFLRKKFNG